LKVAFAWRLAQISDVQRAGMTHVELLTHCEIVQINLEGKKTVDDIEAERRRADLLMSLNAFYE